MKNKQSELHRNKANEVHTFVDSVELAGLLNRLCIL